MQKEIELQDITERQFKKFTHLQKSGKINMTDIVQGSKLIVETQEVYETILWNYDQLNHKFKL